MRAPSTEASGAAAATAPGAVQMTEQEVFMVPNFELVRAGVEKFRQKARQDNDTQTLAQLDAYGVKELHVLEDVLRKADRKVMAAVAEFCAEFSFL